MKARTRFCAIGAPGVPWDLTNAQIFMMGSLLYLGEFSKVGARLPGLMAEASERGNLYATTEFRTRMNFLWLVADEPVIAGRNWRRRSGSGPMSAIVSTTTRCGRESTWRFIPETRRPPGAM